MTILWFIVWLREPGRPFDARRRRHPRDHRGIHAGGYTFATLPAFL
jgi:hypothetical protein